MENQPSETLGLFEAFGVLFGKGLSGSGIHEEK